MHAARQTIPVFYRNEVVADAHSYNPSASKPRHLLAAWQAAGPPISIVPFAPATPEDLALAHDPAYVTGVPLAWNLAGGYQDPFGTGGARAFARAIYILRRPQMSQL